MKVADCRDPPHDKLNFIKILRDLEKSKNCVETVLDFLSFDY